MNKDEKGRFRITVLAEVESKLTSEELESQLVLSLFNIETEEKTSDGDSEKLEVVDYELTEAMPVE